jgi:hypothetical protein
MHTFIVIKILPLAKNKKSDSNRAFFLYALLVKNTNNGGIQEPQPVPTRKDPSFQNNPKLLRSGCMFLTEAIPASSCIDDER